MMNALENSIHQYFGIEHEADSQLVAGLFQQETIAKNEFFLKADKSCHKFGFIESGIIRVFAELPDREVTQWVGTQGFFITDLSAFLYKSKCRFNMQALTECTMYTISYEDYNTLTRIIPKWNELEKLFICKCFITMENRIFSLISLSSEERYNLLFEQQPELFNQVPLQYLASMIGMTPETFSRIRGRKTATL